jgi:hypothetical protein
MIMPEAIAITGFVCPRCGQALKADQPSQPSIACVRCNWIGEAYHFWRLPADVTSAEAALPEDAVCIHHPRKKAVAVCAGTGDYICSLCAIELNGQTFSAEYLSNAGRATLSRAFDRFLPRPDSYVMTYFICYFIPYVDFALALFAFLWLPHCVILYRRALQMRKENEIFRRAMGSQRVIAIPILIGLGAIVWLVSVGLVIAYWSGKWRPNGV